MSFSVNLLMKNWNLRSRNYTKEIKLVLKNQLVLSNDIWDAPECLYPRLVLLFLPTEL